MKVRPSVKKICPKCKIIKRKGKVMEKMDVTGVSRNVNARCLNINIGSS